MAQRNKKIGNDFETELCELLFERGFWVHNMAQNKSGQPADVIAARDGKTYLIDCKVCSSMGFTLSRMEENQDLSMSLWESTGNGYGWFAVRFPTGEIYMISHYALKKLAKTESRLYDWDFAIEGQTFEEWVEKA